MINLEQNFEHLVVVKRSGQRVAFNGAKIAVAVKHSFDSVYESYDEKEVNKVFKAVLNQIATEYETRKTINVEDIQDMIETTLQKKHFTDVYLSFNEYRLRRAASREVFSVKQHHKFVKAIEKIGLTVKNSEEEKPMDLMFNFAKTISREFTQAYLLENKYVRAHEEGLFAIEDMDSYALATTSSSQLNLETLEPVTLTKTMNYYSYLLTHIKEEQYGEQSIPSLDIVLVDPITLEFQEKFQRQLWDLFEYEGLLELIDIEKIEDQIKESNSIESILEQIRDELKNEKLKALAKFAYDKTVEVLKMELEYQIVQLLQNISDFHFKLGSNSVSISLGLGTKTVSRWVQECYLNVVLNHTFQNVETVYKVEQFETDPNHTMVIDAILNNKNILLFFTNQLENKEKTELFSTGELIYHNINHEESTSIGRVILSKSSINLARLGLLYQEKEEFYEALEDSLELCKNQLLQRYEIQASQYKENYGYLFQTPILFESQKLEDGQKIRKVLRHGVMEIGYTGLGECICALVGHKNLDENDFELGREILSFLNQKVEKYTTDNKLNFILAETSNYQVRKHFIAIDKSVFGMQDILKKSAYDTISHYIKGTSSKAQFEIASSYGSLANFVFHVSVAKNVSVKKLVEIIKDAEKACIVCMKVEVGKNDD